MQASAAEDFSVRDTASWVWAVGTDTSWEQATGLPWVNPCLASPISMITDEVAVQALCRVPDLAQQPP